VAVEGDGPVLAAYPQLRVFGGGRAHTATPAAHQQRRTIDLAWLGYATDDAAGKAAWLLDRAAAGGCLCWITNTVAQAQALYRELQQRAPADLPLTLIHSRFPLARREALEHEITDAYGPKSPAARRGIVVGTQVLEQSLDLDFDVMASDLAPVDLLLQRSGRLHRHERKGRPVADAVLYVNVARDSAGAPEWGVNAVIYDEYVLRRTMEALAVRTVLHLPDDFRALVEAVYSSPAPTEDEPDAALRASWLALQTRMYDEQAAARQRLVPNPDPVEPFCAAIADLVFQENDESARWGVAQTRLGAESVTLLPLEREASTARVPGSGARLRLDQQPDREMATELLRQCVRVSHRAVVRLFERGAQANDGADGAEERREIALLDHALLAHIRPLWLREGSAVLAGGRLRLQLDHDLGLVIDSEGKESAE
jgi:CRISPR-associated endonuclease/helicase Cas3